MDYSINNHTIRMQSLSEVVGITHVVKEQYEGKGGDNGMRNEEQYIMRLRML